MKLIEIQEPIWKDRSVGLNVSGVSDNEEVHIRINYVEVKSGKKTYPYTYMMLAGKIRTYPKQFLKGGVQVYLVPIAHLNIVEKEKNNPQMSLF